MSATSFCITLVAGKIFISHITKIGSMPLQVGDVVVEINGKTEWDDIAEEMDSKSMEVVIARVGESKLLRFSEIRKRSTRMCQDAIPEPSSDTLLYTLAANLLESVKDSPLEESTTPPILPSPSAVIYPMRDIEDMKHLRGDLKTSLDEQVRLLAQRRRLATHLHAALKKRRLAEGMVSVMNDQVRQARAATAAAEQQLGRSMQMQDSLREDLAKACSDRGAAITRAVAAEARSAQAERMLAQVLNTQRPTLSSRLRSLLLPQTPEVPA